jgi:type II secretory pathway component PulF
MSLIKSINVLERQEKTPVFKTILNRFTDELKNGKTLSECMDLYP